VEYVEGLLFLGGTLGAVIFASELARRRRLADLRGATRLVAQAVLITSLFALAHLLPGAFGVLTRGSALACAAAIALLALRVPRLQRAARPVSYPPSAGSPVRSWVLASVPLLAVSGLVAGAFLHVATRPLLGTDLIAYDLPIIGRWIQSGSVWPVTELFPFAGTHGTYPHNAHLVLLGVVLPFHNDALVRVATYPYLALAVVGVYGITRELRFPAATALLAAGLFAAIPIVAALPEIGPPDAIATAMFAGGVLFLVRHQTSDRQADLVLAGLGLGFAAGAKWYYASSVAAIVVLWVAVRFGVARRLRVSGVAVLFGVTIVMSGFWLVRNLVEANDPIFPVRVRLLGVTLFDAPRDVVRDHAGFSVADYVGQWGVWRTYLLPAFAQAFAAPGALAGIGVGVAIGLFVFRRSRRGSLAMAAGLALASVVLAALYGATPYSAFGARNRPSLTFVNTRYAIPALVLAVPAAAGLVPRLGRLRFAVELLVVVAALHGVRGGYRILAPGPKAFIIGLAIVAGVAIAVAAATRARRRGPKAATRVVSRPIAMGAAASLAAVATVGYPLQRHYNDSRYARQDPTFAWIQRHADSGAKVGLAGSFDFSAVPPGWPMYGSRIGNRVAFVGRLQGGRLAQYTTAREWAKAVARGRYDLLLVFQSRPVIPTKADEPLWASRQRFNVVARSPAFVLYRLSSG
jgi:hypothetical protein